MVCGRNNCPVTYTLRMLENLKPYNIKLASASPRRRELMGMLGIPFDVISGSEVDESYSSDIDPSLVPIMLAARKARAYSSNMSANDLIIAADTVVICNENILGKPHDREDAYRMLRLLSGRTHSVVTGVSIISAHVSVDFSSVTKVTFAGLTDREIYDYIDTCLPYDKAGAYGIQESIGAIAVSGIEGSYYNVMGLPVHMLYRELLKF